MFSKFYILLGGTSRQQRTPIRCVSHFFMTIKVSNCISIIVVVVVNIIIFITITVNINTIIIVVVVIIIIIAFVAVAVVVFVNSCQLLSADKKV